MSHPENEPYQAKMVKQIEDITKESFVMAERLLVESFARMGLRAQEAKEDATKTIGLIALDIKNQMLGIAQMCGQSAPAQLDKCVDDVEQVLREMKKRNGQG